MELVSLALWIVGALLIVLAVFQAREPFSRMSELDRLADNARRYDSWRGGHRGDPAEQGTTGADIMRQMLRRRVLLWAIVAVGGGVFILAGFAVR